MGGWSKALTRAANYIIECTELARHCAFKGGSICERVLLQVDRNVAAVVVLWYIKICLLRQTSKYF